MRYQNIPKLAHVGGLAVVLVGGLALAACTSGGGGNSMTGDDPAPAVVQESGAVMLPSVPEGDAYAVAAGHVRDRSRRFRRQRGVTFTCAEGAPCVVTVVKDGTYTTSSGDVIVALTTAAKDQIAEMVKEETEAATPRTVDLPALANNLPEGYELKPGTYEIAAGESSTPMETGGIEFMCMAGSYDCTVTVAEDGSITATGGMVTANVTDAARQHIPMTVELPAAMIPVGFEFEAAHITGHNIKAGEYKVVGGYKFMCASDGANCIVTIMVSGTSYAATSLGGAVTAAVSDDAQKEINRIADAGDVELRDRAVGVSQAIVADRGNARDAEPTVRAVMIARSAGATPTVSIAGFTAGDAPMTVAGWHGATLAKMSELVTVYTNIEAQVRKPFSTVHMDAVDGVLPLLAAHFNNNAWIDSKNFPQPKVSGAGNRQWSYGPRRRRSRETGIVHRLLQRRLRRVHVRRRSLHRYSSRRRGRRGLHARGGRHLDLRARAQKADRLDGGHGPRALRVVDGHTRERERGRRLRLRTPDLLRRPGPGRPMTSPVSLGRRPTQARRPGSTPSRPTRAASSPPGTAEPSRRPPRSRRTSERAELLTTPSRGVSPSSTAPPVAWRGGLSL